MQMMETGNAVKNGQAEHINTNLCCYISLQILHSNDLKHSCLKRVIQGLANFQRAIRKF